MDQTLDTFEVIVSQGRVADRTAGALAGAKLTGEALAEFLSVATSSVGIPTAPQQDDWSESLPAAAETLHELSSALKNTLDRRATPVLATNTCAASLATLPEVAARFPDAVLLWVDAHGDFNTPESTDSGYLGGMVLAAACGLWNSGHGAGLNPQQVALIGARDIDPVENRLLDEAGVTVFGAMEFNVDRIIEFVAGRDVWIRVDWDVLEPGFIPAGYRVPGGLLPRQISELFSALTPGTVRGIEFAEFETGDQEVPERLSLELMVQIFQQLRF